MKPDITQITHRDKFGQWLNRYGLTGIGVEVGSLAGEYARAIMKHWRGKELWLIDPWAPQAREVYREPVNYCNWDSAFNSCRQLAEEYKPRVHLYPTFSTIAAHRFFDDSLDFVYIDANHELSAVREDLKAWWRKVKNGGVFCGHDYRVEHNETQCCDVQTAVDGFVANLDRPLHVSRAEGCYSWWMIK